MYYIHSRTIMTDQLVEAINEATDLINENLVKEKSIERIQAKIEKNRERLKVLNHFIHTGELVKRSEIVG